MFLLYRNQGVRRYGLKPIPPHPRKTWEFQVFVEGECTILLQEGPKVVEKRLVGPVLAITGPECVHGYGGLATDSCYATIFHFDEADYFIRQTVGSRGYRLLPFPETELPMIQALYDRCAEARDAIGTSPPEAKKRAGFLEPRIYSIVAMELTLLCLRHIPKKELGPAPTFGESKVSEALAWYEANLANAPTIDEVAKAVHVSATHLRRLFHQIRGLSPQEALTVVQFERAKSLMKDSSISLERIAESSGFESASAFSRAFKAQFDLPPSEYRRNQRDQKADRG